MRALKVQKLEARRITLEFLPEDLNVVRQFVEAEVSHPDEEVATEVRRVMGEIYDMVITYPER